MGSEGDGYFDNSAVTANCVFIYLQWYSMSIAVLLFILLSSPTGICVFLGTWSEGRLRTTRNICVFSSICKGHSWFCVLQSAEVFLFYKAPDRYCAQIPPWEVFLRISLWSDCVIPLIQIKQYRTQHPETPITCDADGVSFFSLSLYWLVVSKIWHDVTFDSF